MIFNISFRIVLGIISFLPFSKTLSQIDISSWKYQYSRQAVGIVA